MSNTDCQTPPARPQAPSLPQRLILRLRLQKARPPILLLTLTLTLNPNPNLTPILMSKRNHQSGRQTVHFPELSLRIFSRTHL